MAAKNKDAVFVWQGTDKQGRKTRGEMTSSTPALVKAQLRKQGIAAKSVKRKPKPLFSSKLILQPDKRSICSNLVSDKSALNSFEIGSLYSCRK